MPGIHHVEIWVVELAAEEASWAWLLSAVGFVRTQAWPGGQTWTSDSRTAGTAETNPAPYLTLTESPNLSAQVHDRRRPGVNHLALLGGPTAHVDALIAAAPDHGWVQLYADRYPHAGGPSHYAGWLENRSGFKVEVVAEG